MGTGELNAGGNRDGLACYPGGELNILLVTSFYGNRDKLRPDGHLARIETLPYMVLKD